MKTMMEHYKETIHGSKIMRAGMMIAEAMLTEGPNALGKRCQKGYRRLGNGKGSLKLPSHAVPDSIAWNW